MFTQLYRKVRFYSNFPGYTSLKSYIRCLFPIKLKSVSNMEQFRNYIRRHQPKDFLMYQKDSAEKRFGFQSVVSELTLNLKGIKFLDIGPGYGDALDICYEKGAKCIEFVEISLLFSTYNSLKGFTKGYRCNYLTELDKQLDRMGRGKYDLIWSKGSFSADTFIANNKLRIENHSLSYWLAQLEELASLTGHIIICPHWRNDTSKRIIEDVHNSWFTETMLNKEYVLLPRIKNHNQDPGFPITFYKNMSQTKSSLRKNPSD